jgi:hypothetical protein
VDFRLEFRPDVGLGLYTMARFLSASMEKSFQGSQQQTGSDVGILDGGRRPRWGWHIIVAGISQPASLLIFPSLT